MEKLMNIKNVLGEPFYSNDSVLIYNMDCRKGLDMLRRADVKIDSTITSPPYNIGKEYEKVMPVSSFIEWLVEVSNNISDITKADGSYLLNVGYLNVPENYF